MKIILAWLRHPWVPISLTDWVEAAPERWHCGILTRAYGELGHDWICPSCDDEPIEEYAYS